MAKKDRKIQNETNGLGTVPVTGQQGGSRIIPNIAGTLPPPAQMVQLGATLGTVPPPNKGQHGTGSGTGTTGNIGTTGTTGTSAVPGTGSVPGTQTTTTTTQQTTNTAPVTLPSAATPDTPTIDPYSSDLLDAYKARISGLGNYGPFKYGRENEYQAALTRILNPEAFSYDLETDPSYIALRDQAVREGGRAMENTLAQVSARTGGLASSYAGSASQQAYNNYLERLNDQVPDLYQNAYNRYLQEYQMQMNALNALQGDRNIAYGMYGDDFNRQVKLADMQGNLANMDYGMYRDRVGDARWDAEWQNNLVQQALDNAWKQYNAQYTRERDAAADAWKQDERDYQRSQDALALQQAADQRAAQEQASLDQQQLSALIALANSGNTEAQQWLNEYYARLAGIDPGSLNNNQTPTGFGDGLEGDTGNPPVGMTEAEFRNLDPQAQAQYLERFGIGNNGLSVSNAVIPDFTNEGDAVSYLQNAGIPQDVLESVPNFQQWSRTNVGSYADYLQYINKAVRAIVNAYKGG